MYKILIVDDDSLVAAIYEEKFRSLGFETRSVSSGREAIGAITEQLWLPDIVLLDLMLGDMTGVDVLKFIRSNSLSQSVPVIVLSNTYLGDMIQSAWKAGATQCLSKTSTPPNRVVEQVQKALLTGKPAVSLPSVGQTSPPIAVPRPNKPLPPLPDTGLFAEEQMQTKLRRQLQTVIVQRLDELRRHFDLWQANPAQDVSNILADLSRVTHALMGSAALAGFTRFAQLACALEALLRQIQVARGLTSASSVRTVLQAIEFLPVLFRHPESLQAEAFDSPLVLVVDDEPISRETLCALLEKVHLHPLAVGDPVVAAGLFAENSFDLIFSDVDMPRMSGFELCEKLRASELNQSTPIVFITSLDDIKTRDRSAALGAVDFIGKPVVPAELALKAMFYLFRGHLLTTL